MTSIETTDDSEASELFWYDTHCHLFLESDPQRSPRTLMDRAEAVGVRRAVVVGIDPESSTTAIELATEDPRLFASVGLHPNSCTRFDAACRAALERLAQNPRVVGIGETGLDYYRMGADPSLQERSFRFHIELARQLQKTLIVHVRNAHLQARQVLRSEAEGHGLPRVVIHCFSGSLGDALDYTSLGAYVSFAGPVTFRSRNAEALRQVVREIALNRVVIETDSPFLSPHPYRGKPNEPANVALVGKEIAELKAMAVKEVAAITTANAIRLFGAPSGAG